jgi:membrane-associated phospholipid phosphatase
MSTAGLAKAERPGILRRAGANLAAWLMLIGRPRRIATARLLPPTRRLMLGVLAAVVCVAAAMLLLDGRGLAFAKTLPFAVVDTFNEITDFGQSVWFLVPIAVLILVAAFAAALSTSRIANLVVTSLVVRLEFLFLAIALPGLAVTIIKRLIGRVRPSDLGPFSYMPWSWRPEYASLPSGHGTTAVAAAIAIGALWPKARVPMWAFAVLIAVSRVVIQAHFASDVIAAAFCGVFGAILVRNWFAARRLGFAVDRRGTVRALPGPSWRRIRTVAGRLIRQ